MNKKFRLTVLLLMSMLQFACGSPMQRQKLETLDYAIDDYGYALRWGRLSDAVAYHIDEEGDRPSIDTSIMSSVRVTSFTITEKTLNTEQTEATVRGEFNYYDERYGTLRSIDYQQRWWYEPDSKKWLLDGEFPQFQ
jgi:hypothetical protein